MAMGRAPSGRPPTVYPLVGACGTGGQAANFRPPHAGGKKTELSWFSSRLGLKSAQGSLGKGGGKWEYTNRIAIAVTQSLQVS